MTTIWPRRREGAHVDSTPTVADLYNLNDPEEQQRLWPMRKLEAWAQPPFATEPNAVFNKRICLTNADVTSMWIDCIVNAANTGLRGGGGIDGAIHAAAGPGLHRACMAFPENEHGERCPTGMAKITDSFRLHCLRIIHTPGPIYHQATDKAEAERQLRSCYRSCLDLAIANGLVSIVFPPISTNIYGYPNALAADVALSTVRSWLDAWLDEKGQYPPIKVVFTNVDQPDMEAYLHLIPKYFPPAPPAPAPQENSL